MGRCRWLAGIAMAWHIAVALLYNVQGVAHSVAIMHPDRLGSAYTTLSNVFNRLQQCPAVALYGQATGLATGYGFFAPQVASPFRIQVVCCQPGELPCDTLLRPSWAKGTRAVRYRAFTSSMRCLLPAKAQLQVADSLAIRYNRVLAANMALRMAQRRQAATVHWQVYAVGLPQLHGRSAYRLLPLADSGGHLNLTDDAMATP